MWHGKSLRSLPCICLKGLRALRSSLSFRHKRHHQCKGLGYPEKKRKGLASASARPSSNRLFWFECVTKCRIELTRKRNAILVEPACNAEFCHLLLSCTAFLHAFSSSHSSPFLDRLDELHPRQLLNNHIWKAALL